MPDRNLSEVEGMFHAVLALPTGERATYLAQACNGDESLHAEVSSLISAFDSRNGFMEEPALNLGLNVLSKSFERSLEGKSVGYYNVISRLGKGGMGEVYLAEDSRLGRRVALKFLSQEFVGDNWAKRQLVKEAQAAAMLDHANICSVYGIEESDEHTFIIMQYVEGKTLADLIRKERIATAQVVQLARQIVGALVEAHAHGIIHRDIKPGNIMVMPNGQVKVLDFGLAKTVHHKAFEQTEDSISHFSRNGVLAGTVAYMSPEQLRGERLDYRSDVFSLGTVIYEIVTGKNPYAQASTAETISAILTVQPVPLGNSVPQATRELGQILSKCMEKDLDQRYQAASALLYDLDNFQIAAKNSAFWRPYAHSRSIVTLALLLLLMTIAAFIYSRVTRVYSLAVMPIVNETGPANDYLSLGLTDALTQKLSGVSKLRVKPQTSVSGYKANEVDLRSVAANLGVDALLVGKIVQEDGSLILETTLVDSSNGSRRRVGKNKLTLAEVFALPEEISRQLISRLELWLGNSDSKQLAARGTENSEAFRQYMLGKYYWKNRNKENIEKAIGYFNEAIRLDPLYAQAHAGVADCYVLLSIVAFGQMKPDEAMARASAAAKEALDIDDALPEAHTSLGVIDLRFTWDWSNAEEKFKRAIELNPDYAPAHYWYSNLLIITGRSEQAITESEIAKNLDPFSPPSTMNFCRTLAFASHYDQALPCFDKLLKENPDYKIAQYMIGLIYQQTGRGAEAIEIFEHLYEADKAFAGAALGYAYGKAGRQNDALDILAEMKTLSKERYIPPQEFAILYLGVGDNDKAFAWLQQAHREHFANITYLAVDPLFATLRPDPRFADLVNLLKLPLPPS